VDPHFAWLFSRWRRPGPAGAGFTPLIRNSALLLCLFAGGLAIYGYIRWLSNEKAMRLKQDLPYTRTLLLISILLTLVIVVVMALVLYAG
jgi:putative membrane protein